MRGGEGGGTCGESPLAVPGLGHAPRTAANKDKGREKENLPRWGAVWGPGPNSLGEAVGSCEHPAGRHQRPAADVLPVECQAGLPRPLPRCRRHAAHDAAHHRRRPARACGERDSRDSGVRPGPLLQPPPPREHPGARALGTLPAPWSQWGRPSQGTDRDRQGQRGPWALRGGSRGLGSADTWGLCLPSQPVCSPVCA